MFSNHRKKKSSPSAFRAVSNSNQQVMANEDTKVFFELEEFDLNREYKVVRSVFIPKENGIYVIVGTLSFQPQSFEENYRVRIELKVNGGLSIGGDNDFWGTGVINTNVVETTSILKLKAGDEVEIYMQSSVDGFIRQNEDGANSTSFAGFKVTEL